MGHRRMLDKLGSVDRHCIARMKVAAAEEVGRQDIDSS